MRRRDATVLLVLGAAGASVGAVGAFVFLLQPWRTCPYDDSPAACAMLPGDFTALMVFALLLLVGLCVLLGALVMRWTAGTRRRT